MLPNHAGAVWADFVSSRKLVWKCFATKNAKNTKNVKNVKNVKNAKNTKNVKNAKNRKNAKNTKGSFIVDCALKGHGY